MGVRGNDPVEMIQGVAKRGNSGKTEVLGLHERMGFRTSGTGLGFSKKAGRLCRYRCRQAAGVPQWERRLFSL